MIDATSFAVLARRFESVATTMQHSLVRSSRSGVIASGHDCSCCILTDNHQLLSAAQTIPIHVMSGADEMARSVSRFHPQLRRGDAFLHNSPYHGCTHAADLTVVVPVVDDQQRHRFTVLAKAHQADIGNSKPTTYMADALDVYEEGALLFPATRIQRDYEMLDDIVRMGRLRIRAPEQWHGDLLALIGAARTGEARLLALGNEFGWERLESFATQWLDYGQSTMRTFIEQLPAAKATALSTHDPFPGTAKDGIEIRVSVEIKPKQQRIVVDLENNEDCLPCGLNLSEASARSAAMIGVFNSLGQDIPTNSGSVSCIEVKLRENCVVGIPTTTTSCSVATTNLADRVANAVQLAMSTISDRLGGAESGAIEGPVGAVISGRNPRRAGQAYINQLALAGTAGGATANADGWLTLGNTCTAGMWTMDSIEVNELNYPMRVLCRELIVDSEGAGRYRGAPSCQVVYEPAQAAMQILYACDGVQNPPKGTRGGGDGAGAKQWLRDREGTLSPLPGLGDLSLQPGEQVIAQSSAGGGYGNPLKRDAQAVAEDVGEGIISRERACSVYGVVCDECGVLDITATHATRVRSSE